MVNISRSLEPQSLIIASMVPPQAISKATQISNLSCQRSSKLHRERILVIPGLCLWSQLSGALLTPELSRHLPWKWKPKVWQEVLGDSCPQDPRTARGMQTWTWGFVSVRRGCAHDLGAGYLNTGDADCSQQAWRQGETARRLMEERVSGPAGGGVFPPFRQEHLEGVQTQ